MKYILLFLCILSLSCKYNVANPVMTLKDYTEGSGIIYYISSSSSVAEIEETLMKNKHSLGKYKIVVSSSSDTDTQILTNIATALKNNSSFNNVEVDISKLTNISKIPKEIFKDLKNLSSITLSDGVTEIEENAFSGCASLANVRFSKELTNIGDGAFSNCVSLKFASLDSEKSMTIGKNAFSGCTSLANLVLSAGLTNIDSSAFSGCSTLVNVEYLGKKSDTSKLSSCSPFSSGSNPSNLYLPSMDGTDTNRIDSTFLGRSWTTTNYGKHIPN